MLGEKAAIGVAAAFNAGADAQGVDSGGRILTHPAQAANESKAAK